MEALRLLAAERLTASFKSGQPVYSGRETGEGAGGLYYAKNTGKFLLCQRSDTGDAPGTWCCLGGGVDTTDPSFEYTVKREAYEEGGVPMGLPVQLWYMNGARVAEDFIFHNYLAVVEEEFEPVLNDEHVDYEWVEPQQLLAYPDLHDNFKAALESPGAIHTLQKRLGVTL